MSLEPRADGILAPFNEARRVLGLEPQDGPDSIKRAYRRAVLEHPPDLDPDAFQRVREAYELLTNPMERARDMLLRPLPFVAAPRVELPKEEVRPRDLMMLILRKVVGQLSPDQVRAILEPNETRPRAKKGTEP